MRFYSLVSFLVSIVATFFLAANVSAASYLIKGVLTYEGHGLGEPPGLDVKIFKREFEVSVDDCYWTIKMTLVGNTNFSYSLSTFDGTNVIYLDRPSPAAFKSLHNNMRHGVTNLFQSCIVESIPVPRTITSIANAYPWLAFASGCYFRTVTNESVWDIIPLNIQLSFFAGRHQIPCHFTLSDSPPYLPTRLQYKWTNITTMSADGKISIKELPQVFGGSFVAGEFKSDEFTNVNGFSFPTKFEMREFRPIPNASNSNDFRCTLIVKGEVTSISATQQSWSSELPNEALAVNDYRFYTNSPVLCYLISNGIVPTLEDSKLVLVKQTALQRLNMFKDASRARDGHVNKIVIRILLAAMAVAPAFLLWKRFWKNKKQKTDKL